ncbi:MAG: SDR family oxidoreductase [Spirochaetales bacterium]
MAIAKTALIAGGTGGLGEGIVKVLLEAGWNVWVPVREPTGGDRLKAFVASVSADRLHLVHTDLSVAAEIASLRKQMVTAAKTVDLVVVSVGSSYYGYSLQKIQRAVWDKLISENISTHFHLQQEFMSQFHEQDHGTYITLTGPEADFAHPETGLMSIMAAAQKMMARVEALEASGGKVKVYSVTSKTPIATRARGEQSAADWLTPGELGLYVHALAEGSVPGLGDPLHVIETRDQLRKLLKLK